ncbi:hypothetical protein ACJ72_04814 [Emergomyces africanus]|uniref:Calcineurin-like phosphoesterase domain-containing protein n=1 Tax=Emergomyces africanus TaxID=1955775 RepID=A0A1B7NVP4_9EURO|nr:hypothetical protein ACJ72_04814 [Emergomyces africanus]
MKLDASNRWPATGVMKGFFTIVRRPRFLRYIIVYVILLWICVGGWMRLISPRLKEHIRLLEALDPSAGGEKIKPWFGTNSLPKFSDLVHLRTLDPALLPSNEKPAGDNQKRKRLIVVGDVHGCLDELESLLQKTNFDHKNGDHLIFTGDLIAKGPESIGVVDLARKHRASCVRGNHEDRVLLRRREAKENTRSLDNEPNKADYDLEAYSTERSLAIQLSDEQANWLDGCPVILKVGSIKGMGEVVVVHGGLVPGVELASQDPSAVMSMRTIDLSSHVPSASSKGVSWTKLFNKHQSMLAVARQSAPPGMRDRYSGATTVIYGHDANPSPSLKKYTKGLDTNCVKGGKLSAMIIQDGGKSHIASVKCKNYTTKRKSKH